MTKLSIFRWNFKKTASQKSSIILFVLIATSLILFSALTNVFAVTNNKLSQVMFIMLMVFTGILILIFNICNLNELFSEGQSNGLWKLETRKGKSKIESYISRFAINFVFNLIFLLFGLLIFGAFIAAFKSGHKKIVTPNYLWGLFALFVTALVLNSIFMLFFTLNKVKLAIAFSSVFTVCFALTPFLPLISGLGAEITTDDDIKNAAPDYYGAKIAQLAKENQSVAQLRNGMSEMNEFITSSTMSYSITNPWEAFINHMPYALVSGGILGAAFDQIVNKDYQGRYHWTDKYKAFASINGETDIFNVDFDNYAKQSVVQKYNAFQDSPFKIGMNYSEQMAGFYKQIETVAPEFRELNALVQNYLDIALSNKQVNTIQVLPGKSWLSGVIDNVDDTSTLAKAGISPAHMLWNWSVLNLLGYSLVPQNKLEREDFNRYQKKMLGNFAWNVWMDGFDSWVFASPTMSYDDYLTIGSSVYFQNPSLWTAVANNDEDKLSAFNQKYHDQVQSDGQIYLFPTSNESWRGEFQARKIYNVGFYYLFLSLFYLVTNAIAFLVFLKAANE